MLEVINVSKFYNQGPVKITALDSVSLAVEKGEFIAIMGPSGSGKSTLLNIIGGLDHLSTGEVHLDGRRIDTLDENALTGLRRGKLAYIFQQYHLMASLNALENVLLPLTFSGRNGNPGVGMEILEKVGLGGRAKHRPAELSGGEQQRVAIARALVGRPSLILADEPTGNMDRKTGAQIMGLFQELNREGHTLIIVTHDRVMAEYANTIVMLEDGRIVDRVTPACSKL